MSTSAATLAPSHRAVPTRRRARRPVPQWWRDASLSGAWGVVLFTLALWVHGGGVADLLTDPGTSLGRLSGLVASALLLLQVLLLARIPWVEQAWGQDELARAHRIVGFSSFWLMVVHIVTISVGYAGGWGGAWAMFVDLVLTAEGMLLAAAGTVCLVMVVVTSIRRARRRLRYESWHLLHLYAYLGVGLALPHQLWTGADFLSSPVATVFWWGLYAVTAGSVLLFRVLLPLWRSLRHPIRVVSVEPAGADATTVTVRGRGVGRWGARAGQFFTWRFLDGPGWSRGNPYSLSAAPHGDELRITAAHLGDGSSRLAELRPGTRVLVEGPYGRLHEGVRQHRKVLLMGSGIGITPLRALLEDLAQRPGDVTVLHRARSREQAYLADELSTLAADRGATYHLLDGPRAGADRWVPAHLAIFSDEQVLTDLVPDVRQHDVYLCGAPGWMAAATLALRRCGVPHDQIHAERFAF